jgi:signal peptidase I
VKSKKGSFLRSASLLVFSVTLMLGVRWLFIEPFVIPSGSMIPTLLVQDHILVTKFSFGLRLPFSKSWIYPPSLPKRGDVVVFRSVEQDGYFMIKRVVGLPGDRVEFSDLGDLSVNGAVIEAEAAEWRGDWGAQDIGGDPGQFSLRREQLGEHLHYAMLEKSAFRYREPGRVIPEGRIFLMGDNRDRSRDSRFWGELPVENLLGRAQFIWLSCTKVLVPGTFLCDPRHIRWQRIFHRIE